MRLTDPLVPSIAYVDSVSRHYVTRNGIVRAVDEVTLEVVGGRLTAIAGPSGSGKSTLLALLGCLDRPTAGSVRLEQHELTLLSRRARRRLRRDVVATVLPQPSDNLLPGRTGRQNLRAAARHRRVGGELEATIDRLAAAVGIGDFVERPAGTMSGGEQQRVALACALIGGTPLVLADEPTGALDDASAARVVEAMVAAAAAGATIVTATHDATVIDAADDVVRLDHGRRVA